MRITAQSVLIQIFRGANSGFRPGDCLTSQITVSTATPPPEDDPVLRETLKRCSPATYYAACKFRANRDPDALRAVVLGVVERFADRECRARLQGDAATVAALGLREDLGLDSLTMMEVVMIAEDVLRITISNEELTRLRTLGAVQTFILEKATGAPPAPARPHVVADIHAWNVAAVGDQVRQIEARSAAPLAPLIEQRPNHA